VLADHEFVMLLAGGQAKIGGTVRKWKTLGIYWTERRHCERTSSAATSWLVTSA
jgi:hypothetical protein